MLGCYYWEKIMTINAPLKQFALTSGAIIFASLFLSACQQKESIAALPTLKKAPPLAQIEISNPSDFARPDEPIYVSYYDLGLTSKEALSVFSADVELPSQAVDIDYDGTVDGLYFVVDLNNSTPVSITIENTPVSVKPVDKVKRVQADLAHKVAGQWHPHSRPPKHQINTGKKEYVGGHFENVKSLTPPDYYTDHSNWIRYEGPGIESDKVGYRFYLDWRNGFDIFGKLTPEPVLHQVGLDGYESYHHKARWGMDILKVGSSLGAGGFGVMNTKNQLEHVANVKTRTARIVENGDLRASVQLDYNDWKSSYNQQNLVADISMHAGSRLANVALKLSKDLPNMATGIVKHENTVFIQGDLSNLSNYGYSYIASWGKQSLDKSPLGMAIFFKKGDLKKVTEDKNNYLAILEPKGDKSQQRVNYYFASVWQPESGINSKDAFIDYLNKEAEKLTQKPRLRIKTRLSAAQFKAPLDAKSALKWTQALADTELSHKVLGYHYMGWDVNRKRLPKFEYDIIGIQPYAYNQLALLTGKKQYSEVIEKVTASFISDQGKIYAYKKSNFNIDNIPPGQNLISLYERTGEAKYRVAIETLREQLHDQPRTSAGAFWHKKKYQGQVWLDGVYMGMPFLAHYAKKFELGHKQQETLNEVVNEFKLTREFLRDSNTGLYYHAWDELKAQSWADKNTGLSQEFWARGMGWLAMAVVDVLDYIPTENIEQRDFLVTMIGEIAVSLKSVQDQNTGTWWQILNKPAQRGNYRESSATAMFIYFYAKAINKGYLAKEYTALVKSAYKGLLSEFTLVHKDGTVSMLNQCYVAGLGFGRDGSYDYYMSEPISRNDPKGVAPYILAGIEMVKLLGIDNSVK